jgi:hypothetical protein
MRFFFPRKNFSFDLLNREILKWFIIIISLQQIDGHGRMEDPPARNAAWRHGRNEFIIMFCS